MFICQLFLRSIQTHLTESLANVGKRWQSNLARSEEVLRAGVGKAGGEDRRDHVAREPRVMGLPQRELLLCLSELRRALSLKKMKSRKEKREKRK